MVRRYFLSLALFFSICACCVISLSKGSMSIPFDQLLFNDIVWKLRFPRTLTAFVSGSLLALAGALMQLLLQNPLADPYALGISGGAAFMTLIFMLLGIGDSGLIGGAWLGSILSFVLIFLLAKKHRWQNQQLLLCGMALACGWSACISFILFISPEKNLHSMLFWLAGDLNNTDFPWFGLLVLGIGMICCLLLAPGLNILTRGDKEARVLGLASTRYQAGLFFLSSFFTATAVTLSGCISFIGLIIPHLTRLLFGTDQRINLPITMVFGGCFLTLADTLSRSILGNQQLPVGIIMGLLGVPLFIGLLQR